MAVRFRNDKLVLTKYEAKHPLVGADGEKKNVKKIVIKSKKAMLVYHTLASVVCSIDLVVIETKSMQCLLMKCCNEALPSALPALSCQRKLYKHKLRLHRSCCCCCYVFTFLLLFFSTAPTNRDVSLIRMGQIWGADVLPK